jgi:hypothetical protein
MATIRDLIDRAIAAHRALADLGESVADEWQYVTDLGTVWQARLASVGDARGAETAPAHLEAAIDRAIDEAGRIVEPHRAIDWMSTLPQVVLLALDEPG